MSDSAGAACERAARVRAAGWWRLSYNINDGFCRQESGQLECCIIIEARRKQSAAAAGQRARVHTRRTYQIGAGGARAARNDLPHARGSARGSARGVWMAAEERASGAGAGKEAGRNAMLCSPRLVSSQDIDAALTARFHAAKAGVFRQSVCRHHCTARSS